jgi:hypothetical protein
MADGAVVGVEAGSARAPVDALFRLLRVDSGSFTFDPAAEVPDRKQIEFEGLLAEAQMRLAEWRAIEAVVPSGATRVDLSDELPASKVTVSATQWRVLRTVAGGAAVDDVASALGVDEFGACQAVKRLVDVGLVVVEPDDADRRSTHATADFVEEDQQADVEDIEGTDEDEVPQNDEEMDKTYATVPDPDQLVTIPEHLRRSPARRAGAQPIVEEPAPRRSPMAEAAARRRRELGMAAEGDEAGDLVGAAAAALTPENAQALVRGLAELGTDVGEAAEAIEAASHARTTEERAAALEGVLTNEQGEPLNRTLLLKFLSSVRA